MRSNKLRDLHLIVFVFLLVLAFPYAAFAQLPTPSQPVLIVQNSASSDPYQNFVPELLTTEGLNGFQTAQLSNLTASFLSNYDVVILPHLSLTAAQATLFQNYVNAGGTLVGFRPSPQLANVFGLNSLGTTLSEAWLKINTATPYGAGLTSQVLRFHGTADAYSLLGATSLATLYQNPNTPSSYPAAAVNSYGSGKAVMFAFDLTQSIVLLRQGNPAWAGYPNNHDGYNTMRPSQMFMDLNTATYWNDLGDGALNDVPQADEEMRLFSNAVVLTNAARRPLPRFWYFPNQARALVLMTGDHHGDPQSNSTAEIEAVEATGGVMQEYLWMNPYGAISSSAVANWQSAGNGFAIHFDDTAEVDSSGVGGSHATWAGMQNVISTGLTALKTAFPTVSAPTTNRNHFLIWVSNDSAGSPDQTAQAKLFQNFGIQMDASFSAFPNRWGYMNASGLPMKFLDTQAGTVVQVYEQVTQYEDDVQLNNVNYSPHWDLSTAQTHYQKSISDSLNTYNTVITFLFHPDHWNVVDGGGNGNYQTYAQTVLQYAQSQRVPIWSMNNWNAFWTSRSAATISQPSFTSNTLSFTVTGSVAGLSLLIPEQSGSSVVSGVVVDGASQSFSVMSLQGILYASVTLTAGTHSISATYASGGTISGTVSPSAAAAATTIQIQGGSTGSVTQTVIPASNGTYTVGPLPPGTYTVTPSSSAYSFAPASQSVPMANSNVTGVNFAATTLTNTDETIFTTQTPVLTSNSDGPGVNYELGTAFTSDVAGQITAIRFWKANGESGAHTGHVWSSSGQLLASLTFTGETAAGWQQQNLTSPLSITAGTQYMVSVNTGNTYYVATSNGLVASVINKDLSTIVGANGVYGSSGQFPTGTWQHTNYFRDIIFVPGTSTTYGISGTIVGAGGNGATLTLSGTASGTTTANSSGAYSFTGLSNGSYTVTPSNAGYTFSPSSASVTVSNGNATATTFTATAVTSTYTISGSITGAGGNGATVTLSGAASGTTTANSSGAYSFTGLSNGSYTVTPSNAGYTFSPSSASVTVNNGNATVPTFTATATAGGSETLLTTQTPAVTGLSDGTSVNYELGTLFQSAVAGQITAIRFWKDSKETGTHTGHLWSSSGQLLATVTFTNETASGWQQKTLAVPLSIIANTTYTVSVNTGGTYYVDTVNGLNSLITNQDLSSVAGSNGVYGTPGQFPTGSYLHSNYFRDVVFTSGTSTVPFVVSGMVTPAAGTTLTLSGAANGSTTPDASGNYSFSGLPNGTYTITPILSGYSFNPPSQTFTITGSGVTGVNFTGSAAVGTSIFTTQTPATTNNSDGTNVNYELGMAFTSSVAGQITAIRFWKASAETGTHTGHIWGSSGQLLATVTFSNETASGWQQQSLATALSIAANAQYVVSVNTGNTYYVATASGLASKVTNGDLSTIVGNNGVYGTTGQFPTGSWQNANYFRDVVFVP